VLHVRLDTSSICSTNEPADKPGDLPACVTGTPIGTQSPLLGFSHRQQPPGPEACGVLARGCRFVDRFVPFVPDRPLVRRSPTAAAQAS